MLELFLRDLETTQMIVGHSPVSYTHLDVYKRQLYESGKLIEQTSEQYYDPEAKQFLADRYITGTCCLLYTSRCV